MTVPEARQDPRLRRFRLRRHRIHCAGGELSVVAPARGDDLLEGDAAIECLRTRQMPYWAEIWPASVGLARMLMRAPPLAGIRAMDLGCGIGIAGLAALQKGAHVRFVDLAPDALHFAAFNARHAPPEQKSFEQLDWSDSTASGPCDLLLLADVAYEERNFEPLERHLRELLLPSGRALLTDPFRIATDGFLDLLRRSGWKVESESFDTSFCGERITLRLATIRRADARYA